MAKPEGKFHKKMMDEGYCDDRGVVFCATATSLPNGEYGIVLLALHGDILSIYDVLDMHNTIGVKYRSGAAMLPRTAAPD
ncbi:MAG: hypothetical protein IJJ23_07255, partial [Clostridia bacterium]|nr:hypothetical protein [Clostridia bacterium]